MKKFALINKSQLKQLAGIYHFIIPYKWQFIIGMIGLVFSSLTLLSFPLISGELLDVASGNKSWLSDNINVIALCLLAVFLVQSVFSFIRVYFFAQVNEKSSADIRRALYQKLITLPIAFYDQHRTGELISRITSDISLLQSTFSVTLAEFLRQIATLLIGTIVIVSMAPKLTGFMFATFPILIVLAMIFGRYIRRLTKQTQDQLAASSVIVEETLQAIRAVKAFTSELFEAHRYQKAIDQVVNTALKAARFRALFVSFIIFVLFGGIVGVLWYGASLVQQDLITIGDLISFILYTTLIGGSIAGLGDLYGQIQRAIGASERVLDILAEESELIPSPAPLAPHSELSLKGNIQVQHISFAYPMRSDVTVLKDISFQINSGEKIALVGHSGAGKSTLAQLLLQYYPVQEGEILIDDRPIQDFNLTQLRQQIGLVPQEVILFGGTIRENISYGKEGAPFALIEDAARQANAFDFIESFPEGFDTLVGERGIQLSGGQRQRIAIARAILKDPSILILDEATSSLDAESEFLVQQALERLMQNRTTIIIAHRLATIRKVDRIYVLKNGQVVEAGTHEQLYASAQDYRNLVELQMLSRS
ncbi:MAG: ABC transporter transmembrane domain-containing protein [Cyclobacteriaceae bacterium]